MIFADIIHYTYQLFHSHDSEEHSLYLVNCTLMYFGCFLLFLRVRKHTYVFYHNKQRLKFHESQARSTALCMAWSQVMDDTSC